MLNATKLLMRQERLSKAIAIAGLTLLVSGCATAPSTSDCHPLIAPPITMADVDAISDDLAIWHAAAADICGW